MTDFEQRIRDSLRRADDLVVPGAPLDPERIAAATRRASLHGPGRHWLAVAAAIAVVAAAGVGSWAWLGRGNSMPAIPAAPATAVVAEGGSVLIDLYSGRENPRVPLDAAVTRELYAMIADHEAAGLLHKTGSPDFAVGVFRGFVLTPADGSLPELRILADRVVVHGSGDYRQLLDPHSLFYDRVLDAVRPLLGTQVLDALPNSNPLPHVTATVPPTIGARATWVLADPKHVDSTSTSLQLKATRSSCASGTTGKLLPPVVSLGSADIVIRVDAVPLTGGARTCQYNNSVTVRVTLPEPVGVRSLVDAACLEYPAIRGRECANGGTRWTP